MNKTFTLRLEEDLYGKVKYQAAKNKRSFSKEVEYALCGYINNIIKIKNSKVN